MPTNHHLAPTRVTRAGEPSIYAHALPTASVLLECVVARGVRKAVGEIYVTIVDDRSFMSLPYCGSSLIVTHTRCIARIAN